MSNTDRTPDIQRPPTLTSPARDLLRRALKGEQIAEDTPGLGELARLGVLRPEPYRPSTYVLSARSDIERHLHAAAEQQLVAAAGFMAQIQGFLEDIDGERGLFGTPSGDYQSRFLDGSNEVHKVLTSLTYAAQREVLTMHPGARRPEHLKNSESRDTEMMERGVVLRTIYQRSNLTAPHVRRYVAMALELGAQIRTVDAPLTKTIVIDGTDAFVPDLVDGRPAAAGAWHIRDPAAIGYIRRAFENEWLHAVPWDTTPAASEAEAEDSPAPAVRPITSARQRSILRGISQGHSYAQIGRQLGWKVRTVGAEMAQLRSELGMETNEQVMYWFATSSDRHVRD
ncbi:hypothetical protein ABR738_00405 [Streptomyces sp. Edi4]|uniref:helix-turn-helix transcriptional regulator n=1 Tax=Streptomyces sp. Edi4 TaxID=3162527 RepID=UPI003306824B